MSELKVEMTLNNLCAEYRALPASAVEERRNKLGEMYLICEKLAVPLVNKRKNLSRHKQDADSDRFDEVVWDKMEYLANWPNTDPNNFTHLYLNSLPKALIDMERKIRTSTRATRNMTSMEREDNDRTFFATDHFKATGREYSVAREETDDLKQIIITALEPFDAPLLRLYAGILEGKKYRELADEQNIPIGTVKSRVSRVHQIIETIPELKSIQPEVNNLSLLAKEELAHKILGAVHEMLNRKGKSGFGIAS